MEGFDRENDVKGFIDRLNNAVEVSQRIDLDEPIELLGIRSSWAWHLAMHSGSRALLASKPALLKHFLSCDLNAAPEAGVHKGITVAWWLAASARGRALLGSKPALLAHFLSCDLNAAPDAGDMKGVTVAAWLAASARGRALLASKPALLAHFLSCDLNAAAEAGDHKGETVACWLAAKPEGRALLASKPALLAHFLSCDLNAAAEAGDDKGKTVAYWLAASATGRALLASKPALLAHFLSCDLNAAAEAGDDKGKTVAYWLAASAEGRALLASKPALLEHFSSCDLNAAAEAGVHKGKTVAYWVARELNNQETIKCLFILNPTLSFDEDADLLEKDKADLRNIKNSLKESIERAYVGTMSYKVLNSDTEYSLPAELATNIFLTTLLAEHPELALIRSKLERKDAIDDLVQNFGVTHGITLIDKRTSVRRKIKETGKNEMVSFWSTITVKKIPTQDKIGDEVQEEIDRLRASMAPVPAA